MKQETKEKLKAINKDVPGIIRMKAVEKILKVKDSTAIFFAIVEIVLVIGIAVAFFIFLDPDVNVISAEEMSNAEKIVSFIGFSAIAILLFFYNRKFFSKAARDTKWQWQWKAKR